MTKTFNLNAVEYTSKEDIIKVNAELGLKATRGELLPLRQEKNLLQLAEPRINGIWNIYLTDKGFIEKIVLF